MLKIYALGMIMTFIYGIYLCREEEKKGYEVNYGNSAILALASWLGLIALIYYKHK